MLNRVKISAAPAARTRWPISVQDDGLNGPVIQINALYRWICIYLD